jgi:DNA-binding HxlR family transcriptional regulator
MKLSEKNSRALLAEKNRFNTACAVPKVLEQIGGKWAILIIYALSQGTKRYSELQRQIEGVSPKMLIQNLRSLETCGLVKRDVYPIVPPQVDYSLTPLGDTLIEPLAMLYEWSIKNVHRIEHAQMQAKL